MQARKKLNIWDDPLLNINRQFQRKFLINGLWICKMGSSETSDYSSPSLTCNLKAQNTHRQVAKSFQFLLHLESVSDGNLAGTVDITVVGAGGHAVAPQDFLRVQTFRHTAQKLYDQRHLPRWADSKMSGLLRYNNNNYNTVFQEI